MIVWHDSVLKRRIREAIAGFVLVYVKGRLMGELFRASAVALNMVEISLSEGFFFFFLNCTGKGLLMSQLCLGELYFMPLVLNMSVLPFGFDSAIHKGELLAMLAMCFVFSEKKCL